MQYELPSCVKNFSQRPIMWSLWGSCAAGVHSGWRLNSTRGKGVTNGPPTIMNLQRMSGEVGTFWEKRACFGRWESSASNVEVTILLTPALTTSLSGLSHFIVNSLLHPLPQIFTQLHFCVWPQGGRLTQCYIAVTTLTSDENMLRAAWAQR